MASRRLLALTGCRRSEILGLRWEHAGLEGVRIHDLRHSYASHALALGEKRQNMAFMTPDESAGGNRIALLKQTPERPAAGSARTGVAESIAEDLL